MNAVIYARYSSYNQTERSIEGQIEDCTKYAKQNDLKIVASYIDRARTGTDADGRPEFQRMVSESEKHQFDVILVYKLDRFARNRYDSAMYKAKLKKNGVRVVSIMETISEEPEGIILESLLEGMAEYYSANLSQNVKRGMRVACERGTSIGGVLVYGYKSVDKKIMIDEHEAEAIRYLFSEYSSNKPLKKIVGELTDKGFRTRSGALFTINSFHGILKNKKYTGTFNIGDEVISNMYPRIIDDETFDKAQAVLESHKRAPAVERAIEKYQLNGKLFCGMCGAPMTAECGRGDGGVYHYYSCVNRKKHHTCKKKNEKKGFIEWYVVEQTMNYVLTPKRIDYITDKLIKEYEKEFSVTSVRLLERKLEEIETEITNCVNSYLKAKSDVIRNQLDARADELAQQKEDIKIDIAKLKIASGIKPSPNDIKNWLKSFQGGDPLDEDFRQRVIDTFVNAVFLYDDKVILYYNIKGGKQVSYVEMCNDIEASIDDSEPVDSKEQFDFDADCLTRIKQFG